MMRQFGRFPGELAVAVTAAAVIAPVIPPSIPLVIVPLLLPTARLLGIDPAHFGIVEVINFKIELITPPHGLILFVLSGLTGVPLQKIFRAILPFALALITLLGVLVAFPQIVLFLPQAFGY